MRDVGLRDCPVGFASPRRVGREWQMRGGESGKLEDWVRVRPGPSGGFLMHINFPHAQLPEHGSINNELVIKAQDKAI